MDVQPNPMMALLLRGISLSSIVFIHDLKNGTLKYSFGIDVDGLI